MKTWLALALAVVLAGCGGKPADIPEGWAAFIQAEQAEPPEPPDECRTASDPDWKLPPATGEDTLETARRETENKIAFRELRGLRRTCAAGINVASKGGK